MQKIHTFIYMFIKSGLRNIFLKKYRTKDAYTLRTIHNIKKTLRMSIEKKYGVSDTMIRNILKIHGMHIDNFDFVHLMEQIINGKLNDKSIDDNANKEEKTIGVIKNEVTKSVDKALGYDYLYRTMRELYGKEEAKRLSGEMYDFSLALSDSTNILVPYCFAIDASKLVMIGRDFGQLKSSPANRVDSYSNQLCETIHQLSTHLAGAIAIGTYFLDLTYLLIHKHKYDISQLQDPVIYKYIENNMQSMVHSFNHLSRFGAESPFTNISIYDRPKLRKLITEMSHLFPVDTTYTVDYYVEYIIAIEKIFLSFFDKGDPLAGGLPYRFPVVTVNISKPECTPEETIRYQSMLTRIYEPEIFEYLCNHVILDREFFTYVSQTDIFRCNIYGSEGSKTASCCRLLSDSEMLAMASSSNSFGGTSISLGSGRVVTPNFPRMAYEAASYPDFFEILRRRTEDTAKILKAHMELLRKLEKKGLEPFITNGWIPIGRLFSTFGIVGIAECVAYMRNKFSLDPAYDFMEDILIIYNSLVHEFSVKYGIIGNIEQIPAESMAIRLAEADALLFPKETIPAMYSNQFVPLWDEATLYEKFLLDGKYNQLLTGGGITHGQIGEELTTQQKQQIILFALVSGCEHFALNKIYSICEHGHVIAHKVQECPICHGEIVDYMTRVVGFFTRVSNWNKTRREFEFPKRTFSPIDNIIIPHENLEIHTDTIAR